MAGELLSQRQFAQRIGRSNVWVSKLVKAGKIPTDASGKIPLAEGLAAYEASQRVGYDANREHAAKQRTATPKAAAPAKSAPARQKKAAAPDLDIPGDDDDQPMSSGSVSSARLAEAFNRARTAEKTYQAKLKELEYKEAQGLLIAKDAVEADAAATASAILEKLRSVGPRIAPLCEGKPAREIEAVIDAAINDALAEIQNSKFWTD